MRVGKKRFRSVFILLFTALFLVLGVNAFRFYYVPIVSQPTELYLPQGSTIHTAINELTLSQSRLFLLMAKWRHVTQSLRAGEYELPAGTTADQLLKILASGKVRMRDVKIIEGWSFAQVLNAFHQNPYLEHNLVGKSLTDITAQFGTLEGNFFPDTYLFARGTSETEILSQARKLMRKQLQKAWLQRAANLPYQSSHEALIVASLVEKETAVNSERAQIAGVILRRLQKNMYLQIDPTVIYALGDAYRGKLHKDDLSVDSPFNTYKNKGLPPTAIAMPGYASINAAMHPAAGTSLYYVARGDGSHEFTDNLQAHEQAIQKYLKSKGNL